jgi:hypothetical protein
MKNHQGLNHHYDGIITIPAKIVLSCLLAFWAVSSNLAFAQNPIALEYDQIQLREDFSDKSENWPYLTTMENLYVPDKGEYFLHRRNKTNPYAIIATWQNNLAAFNILSALKLGPSDRANQTAGIIFLVQGNGKGAIAFEFNKFKQYRIKQLVGAYYKFLSGDNESQGWVKSSALAGKNDYNEIDIRVNLPQVDIYVNKKLLQSFDIMDYKGGSMGYLVGADTKAKSDYFYVYTTQEGKVEAELDSKTTEENNSAVVQLSKLRYELEQKKRSLKECELERKTAVSVLEEEMGGLRQSNERLAVRNRGLQEFKDQVLVEVDEDVFLTLAENLKAEIVNNQKLESQVSVYKDSLKYTHVKYSKLKLALLDKAIQKAGKEKVVRDKKEAQDTKVEIETELKDKNMKAEQEEWETENPGKHLEVSDTFVAPTEPKAELDVSPTPKNSGEVVEEETEARPLPVKVRKAQKKQD